MTALEKFNFDTVMFPISFADYYLRDFGKAVLDAAEKRGSAVVAIKAMSMGSWPQGVPRTRDWWYRTTETPEEVSLALRFSLSLKGVVAGIPPSFTELLTKAVVAARDYQPATTKDRDQLRELSKKCESLFLAEDKKGDGLAGCRPFPVPVRLHECPGHWA